MKGAILREPGSLVVVDDLPEPPAPGPGEALLAVRRVGVCGTDLHAFHGRQPFFSYPRILGHELAVEVLSVGASVTHIRPGDLCAVRAYIACGACDACARGVTNACERLTTLGVHVDGGMRERIVLPAAYLHSAPGLSPDAVALVETLGIGAHAVRRGAPDAADRVLVVGAGPIGLGVATFVRARGTEPVIADLVPERRAVAGSWGGYRTIDPADEGPAAVRAAFGGELPTVVFDATGSSVSMHASLDLVAPGGRLVLRGALHRRHHLPRPGLPSPGADDRGQPERDRGGHRAGDRPRPGGRGRCRPVDRRAGRARCDPRGAPALGGGAGLRPQGDDRAAGVGATPGQRSSASPAATSA